MRTVPPKVAEVVPLTLAATDPLPADPARAGDGMRDRGVGALSGDRDRSGAQIGAARLRARGALRSGLGYGSADPDEAAGEGQHVPAGQVAARAVAPQRAGCGDARELVVPVIVADVVAAVMPMATAATPLSPPSAPAVARASARVEPPSFRGEHVV